MARRTKPQLPQSDLRTRVECFLLCDFARVENEKLYIIGGGWDRILPPMMPFTYEAYLAIKLILPGEQALESFSLEIQVVDETGNPVGAPLMDGTAQARLTAEGAALRGEDLPEAPVFLSLKLALAIQEPGAFRVQLIVNDDMLAESWFSIEPPLLEGFPTTKDE